MKNILLLILLFILIGCGDSSTEPDPPTEFWNNATEITDIIVLHSKNSNLGCFDYDKMKENTLVRVDDTSSFQQYITSLGTCTPFQFLSVDFAKRTLLTRRIGGGVYNFTYKLYINESLHRYHYRLHTQRVTAQMPYRIYPNFISVPKLKSGYILTSDTTYIDPWR